MYKVTKYTHLYLFPQILFKNSLHSALPCTVSLHPSKLYKMTSSLTPSPFYSWFIHPCRYYFIVHLLDVSKPTQGTHLHLFRRSTCISTNHLYYSSFLILCIIVTFHFYKKISLLIYLTVFISFLPKVFVKLEFWALWRWFKIIKIRKKSEIDSSSCK